MSRHDPCCFGDMPNVINFRDLETWQVAMDLVERCYKATMTFPPEERYGLTAQLRRAAVSIPSNVAEGHSRKSTRAYANHVSIAMGSHGELGTCIEISRRLGLLSEAALLSLVTATESVGRLLGALYRSLETRIAPEECTS